MLDARQLTSLLKGQLDADRFAQWLNESNTADLGALPSFIPAKDALRKDSETKVALASWAWTARSATASPLATSP